MCDQCKERVDDMLRIHKECMIEAKRTKEGRMTSPWPMYSHQANIKLRQDMKDNPSDRYSLSTIFMFWLLLCTELDIQSGLREWKVEGSLQRHKDGLYDWICSPHDQRSDDLLKVMEDLKRNGFEGAPLDGIASSKIYS